MLSREFDEFLFHINEESIRHDEMNNKEIIEFMNHVLFELTCLKSMIEGNINDD